MLSHGRFRAALRRTFGRLLPSLASEGALISHLVHVFLHSVDIVDDVLWNFEFRLVYLRRKCTLLLFLHLLFLSHFYGNAGHFWLFRGSLEFFRKAVPNTFLLHQSVF